MRKFYYPLPFLLSIALITSCILIYPAFGQSSESNKQGANSNKSLKESTQIKYFNNIINSNVNNTIGNFASFDVKDAAVTFAGNVPLYEGSMLGLKFNGAITDGISKVFSNSTFNTKFAFDIQWSLVTSTSDCVFIDNSIRKAYNTRIRDIRNQAELKTAQVDTSYRNSMLRRDILRNAKKILSLSDSMNKSGTDIEKDVLRSEINILNIVQQQLSKRLKPSQDYDSSITEVIQWKDSEEKKAEKMLGLTKYSIGWLSVQLGLSNNRFKLFNEARVPDSQVINTNFFSPKIGLQYNYYSFEEASNSKTYLVSIGTSISSNDNFSDLDKLEIKETKNYGANSNERISEEKYTAYAGDYKKELLSIDIHSDLYWFGLGNNFGAIHLYPKCTIAEKVEPLYSLGTGMFISFVNSDKKESVVNMEVFIEMFHGRNKSGSIFKNSDYGLRFTFPFNFNSIL